MYGASVIIQGQESNKLEMAETWAFDSHFHIWWCHHLTSWLCYNTVVTEHYTRIRNKGEAFSLCNTRQMFKIVFTCDQLLKAENDSLLTEVPDFIYLFIYFSLQDDSESQGQSGENWTVLSVLCHLRSFPMYWYKWKLTICVFIHSLFQKPLEDLGRNLPWPG